MERAGGRSLHALSTVFTGLSTEKEDNSYLLTCVFTTYPQKEALPITTIFIYKYLSPQANLWFLQPKPTHSTLGYLYAKLSNLKGLDSPTIRMRASA